MGKNYNLAMRYKDVPLPIETFSSIRSSINDSCRHYILGRACIIEKERLLSSGSDLHDLGSGFGYAKSSVQKFVTYAKAIDYLQSVSPALVIKILDGNIRLSMENTIRLSHKEISEIFRIAELLSNKDTKVADIFPCRESKTRKALRRKLATVPVSGKPATIKDIPAYDPDALASSLSYTIPSWVNTIERVFMNVDFCTISVKARYKLRKELVILADTAGIMIDTLREKNDG